MRYTPVLDQAERRLSLMTHRHTVIFTDLDHTLLDARGGLGKAAPFIRRLAARGIPVIPATSKTAAEVLNLWRRWSLHGPAVVENGAALCLPRRDRGWYVERLTTWRYTSIRAAVRGLRSALDLPLEGFGDWSLGTVCRLTGLSPINALAARTRMASEPLRWSGSPDQRLLDRLRALGLTALQGGRFLTVQPLGIDKSTGASALLHHLYAGSRRPRIIALGDAPNDRRLLEMADLAACLPGPNPLPADTSCLHARQAGPTGWIDALTRLGVA
ncbi:hypothetical protein BJI67_05250 [Acidihalobacter aeolianus]|uniref:Mannosyl-3-phosphoglycerate phosphatase n=1 Tax=Acidihalobacter aeolianus TaxID=2792603 RepID=A0A1D8K6E8_9GAMM|nr:HAD hydrolase family protein [Acidihalobacter aeolianus]AOV16555.1 hypothetical protein BJI67_05250 [Acidihalobacter aeolianus]